jgi:hypothetical protein
MIDLFEQNHSLWWYVIKGTHQAAPLNVGRAKHFCTLVGSLLIRLKSWKVKPITTIQKLSRFVGFKSKLKTKRIVVWIKILEKSTRISPVVLHQLLSSIWFENHRV